jgi:S-adenosylmethionine-dependent methyltransferase
MTDEMITPNTFDSRIENWLTERRQPWGILKYKLAQTNLAKHLGHGPLWILDAGGGDGVESLHFAEKGHSVTIVDFSRQMLQLAAQQAEAGQVKDRLSLQCADVMDIPTLFPKPCFDLVLCHNVLQYIENVASLFKSLYAPLKVGGLISLISINRFSIPYHAAFLGEDLTEALKGLDTHVYRGRIFDATLINYSVEEIKDFLQDTGF